jgi:hypothetical protein
MNLANFKQHIRTVDHATLDSYFDDISGRLRRARSGASRLGYSLAIDALTIESEMRRHPVSKEIANMSDEELYAALVA